MNPVRLLGGIALVFALAGTAVGQPATYPAVVVVPEVEVRSGPSDRYYATGKLRQGQPVEVHREREQNGYLAITPPEGSFSWINSRFVQEYGQTAVVLAPDADVFVGSQLVDRQPDVKGARVQPGTQVVLIGKPFAGDGGTWLPIRPVPSEVRFVPPDAVRAAGSAPAAGGVAGALPSGGPAPTTASSYTPSRWSQALQAELAGNVADAAQLYAQAALDSSATNARLAAECQRRSQWLLDGQRNGTAAANPASSSTWGASPPAAPPPVTATVASLPGGATSQYTYARDPAAPSQPVHLTSLPPAMPRPVPEAGPAPSAGTASLPPAGREPTVSLGGAPGSPAQLPPADNPPMQRSGAGQLSRAPFFIVGNRPTYRLESSQPAAPGQPLLYVTAKPGLNLEPFVNRNVELFGQMIYSGQLRANYMEVVQVMPLP
jgi:hypothetical protein